MNFYELSLLMNENTVAQLLKQRARKDENISREIKLFEPVIRRRIRAEQNIIDILTKYFTYQYLADGGDKSRDEILAQTADYLQAMITPEGTHFIDAELRSQLNNPKFTIKQLRKESERWHEELAAKQGGKGAEGQTIIKLDHLGTRWKGWEWVSLDQGYCREEGRAMGHCGNAAGKPGDNILSLRDPQNQPHLTFIINDKILGEMKGRANTKPKAAFHPAIAELLKSDYVDHIFGGGYKPEANFKFKDLDQETRDEILEEKPDINNKGEIYERQMRAIQEELEPQIKNLAVSYSVDGEEDAYISFDAYLRIQIPENRMTRSLPKWDDHQTYRKIREDINKILNQYDIYSVNHLELDDNTIDMSFTSDESNTPANFRDFLETLISDVDPNIPKLKSNIYDYLTGEGYLKSSYYHQAAANWTPGQFTHFKWEVGDHGQMEVRLAREFQIGSLAGRETSYTHRKYIIDPTQSPGFNELTTALIKWIVGLERQISQQNRQLYLAGFPRPSADLNLGLVVPEIEYHVDSGNTPDVYLDFVFYLSSEHSNEQGEAIQRFIQFTDRNFDAFVKTAQNLFNKLVLPHYPVKQPKNQVA